MSQAFGFRTVIKAPPGFASFIQDFIGRIRLPDGSTPIYRPENDHYFIQAFMSPSSKPVVGTIETNKNFEWIGDTVLALAATRWLDRYYHNEDTGRLTARRQCMVGNNSGLMDLAKELGIERWVCTLPGRGGKKQLPSIVESLIGVVDKLYGQSVADSFLIEVFDQQARLWFDKYLPAGVRTEIANSESNPLAMNDLLGNSSISYHNELAEYLQHHHTAKELDITYKPIGTRWSVCIQVEIDNNIYAQTAEGQSKKTAKNIACYQLLQVVKGLNLQELQSGSLKRRNSELHLPVLPPFYRSPSQTVLSTSVATGLFPTSNYKGVLLTLHTRGMIADPVYTCQQSGQYHALQFTAECIVGIHTGKGTGQRKTEAEQAAAKNVLEALLGYRL